MRLPEAINLLSLKKLRGADDVRTYWQTAKEWFEVPVLSRP